MTDIHCHPCDLLEYMENAEEERRKTNTACATNSWNREQFEYHINLAKKAREENAAAMFCCFALHPQLSADYTRDDLRSGLELLNSIGGRMDAVGETGFDLYGERYRAGEKLQDEMFAAHLEAALRRDLPMILHIRRAMHKIFPFAKDLKKLPSVVFHSWPGTRGEGEALIRRGINVFFAFNAGVLKNHREAIDCAAHFPAERILLETDAPYQPLRGNSFSSWRDLEAICRGIADLRKAAGSEGGEFEELEAVTTANFFRVFAAPGADGR